MQMDAHDANDRRIGQCSWCVCVCVHPWTKGFPPLLLPQFFNHLFRTPSTGRGAERDLQGSAQRSSLQDPRKRKLITSVYLLVLSQAVTPLFHFLIHGSSRFPPHKHSSPAAVQPVRFPPLASANIVQQYCFS